MANCIHGNRFVHSQSSYIVDAKKLHQLGFSTSFTMLDGCQYRNLARESMVFKSTNRRGGRNLSARSMGGEAETEKLVIVGAGIAGLSAALALHKVGIKSVVLEQSSSRRSSGTSLTIWTNAWRALDALGVGETLRRKHSLATGVKLVSREGRLLRSFVFDESPGGPHEVRGVDRKVLQDTLLEQLPPDTVRFNSQLRTIKRLGESNITELELANGSRLSTKVLLGCDGINSVVANWMGLAATRYVGQIGIRGVALYPHGHNYGTDILTILGQGVRTGVFPVSATKIYWFTVFNRSTTGEKVTDPYLMKEETLGIIRKQGFGKAVEDVIESTPMENFTRSSLRDRWNIPGITPSLVKDGVTLAGDAFHPMTPNLGQGGCTAIEDGVVFARSLSEVLSSRGEIDEEQLRLALEQYVTQRHERTFPLALRSYLMGILLQLEFPPVCYIRDKFVVPYLVRPHVFLSHTLFDVGLLHVPETIKLG